MSIVLAVDTREICGTPAGKGSYLRGILEGLLEASSSNDTKRIDTVLAYLSKGQEDDPYLQILCSKASQNEVTFHIIPLRSKGLFWHLAAVMHAKRNGAQAFYACLSYLSAVFARGINVFTVVHDLAVFMLPTENHNFKSKIIESLTLTPAIKRSAHVFCVSENTKNDLLKKTRIDASKVSVCYPATNHPDSRPLSLRERSGNLLFVSTLQPRKGVSELLEAYALLADSFRSNHHLILAGRKGWGGIDYEALSEKLGISQTTSFTGYAERKTIDTLLSTSRALVYPSRYEGFGMPILEAGARGTPSIVTDSSSMPEAVGQTPLCVPVGNVQALSQAMYAICTDDLLWQTESERIHHHSQRFSWKASAEKVLKVISEYE